MRHNRSQTRQRRSHHGLSAPAFTKCSNCGALRRPHHMCLACGYYRGRQVMDLTAKNAKRATRIADKKERIRAQSSAPNADAKTGETEK